MILVKVGGVLYFPPPGIKFGSPFDLIVTLLIGFVPRLRNKVGATTKRCSTLPSEHLWNIRNSPSKRLSAVWSERSCTLLNSGNGEPAVQAERKQPRPVSLSLGLKWT